MQWTLYTHLKLFCFALGCIKKGNKKGGLTKLKVVKNDREANQSISKFLEVKECNNFPSE